MKSDKRELSRHMFYAITGMLLVVVVFAYLPPSTGMAGSNLQIPTGSIPTVTSTPMAAVVTVRKDQDVDQINVRAGPDYYAYEAVGVLIVGQTVPGLGRTPGGDWIEIAYPGAPGGVGWVYSPLVDVLGNLPIIQPPPTPTPRTTPTVDPTLAAQFLVDLPPTRMPTFTPPPPLVMPTFPAAASTHASTRVPMGLLIIGMAAVGIFGALISLLRGR